MGLGEWARCAGNDEMTDIEKWRKTQIYTFLEMCVLWSEIMTKVCYGGMLVGRRFIFFEYI